MSKYKNGGLILQDVTSSGHLLPLFDDFNPDEPVWDNFDGPEESPKEDQIALAKSIIENAKRTEEARRQIENDKFDQKQNEYLSKIQDARRKRELAMAELRAKQLQVSKDRSVRQKTKEDQIRKLVTPEEHFKDYEKDFLERETAKIIMIKEANNAMEQMDWEREIKDLIQKEIDRVPYESEFVPDPAPPRPEHTPFVDKLRRTFNGRLFRGRQRTRTSTANDQFV